MNEPVHWITVLLLGSRFINSHSIPGFPISPIMFVIQVMGVYFEHVWFQWIRNQLNIICSGYVFICLIFYGLPQSPRIL